MGTVQLGKQSPMSKYAERRILVLILVPPLVILVLVFCVIDVMLGRVSMQLRPAVSGSEDLPGTEAYAERDRDQEWVKSMDRALELYELANSHLADGECCEAEPLFLEASEILKKTVGERDYCYLANLNNLGSAYVGLGEYERAKGIFLETSAVFRKNAEPCDPSYELSFNGLGRSHMELGEFAQAKGVFAEAREAHASAAHEDCPAPVWALYGLGMAYLWLGECDQAKEVLLEARQACAEAQDGGGIDLAHTLNALAYCHMGFGEYANAEPLYNEAIAIYEAVFGQDHIKLVEFLEDFADFLEKTGRPAEAEPIRERAERIQLTEEQAATDEPGADTSPPVGEEAHER